MEYLDQEAKVVYTSKSRPGHRSGDGKSTKVFDAREWLAAMPACATADRCIVQAGHPPNTSWMITVNFPLMTIPSIEILNSPGINISNRDALKFDLGRAGQIHLKTVGNVLYGVKINKKMSTFIKKAVLLHRSPAKYPMFCSHNSIDTKIFSLYTPTTKKKFLSIFQ